MDMFGRAILALVPALLLVGSVDARAQANVTGGYICQGNCAAPGQCSRAYVDGFWPGRNHIAFYNNVGPASEGGVSATRVVQRLGWAELSIRIGSCGIARACDADAVWMEPACRFDLGSRAGSNDIDG